MREEEGTESQKYIEIKKPGSLMKENGWGAERSEGSLASFSREMWVNICENSMRFPHK